ncbi:MAG: hypothetical protein MK097_22060, partial [Dechloromonas sp.]|nr:hypothetical protein [Dechloromonas sp.]
LNDNYTSLNPLQQYQAAKAQFESVAARAQGGDADALGQLQDVSQAYLDASKSYYASSEQYFSDFAEVQRVLDASQDAAQHQVNVAQQQLSVLNQQVGALIDINNSVMSVAEAISNFMAAQAAVNSARNWGARPEVNKAIVSGLAAQGINYTGNFGDGSFAAWVAAQPQSVQAIIQQVSNAVPQDIINQYARNGGLLRGYANGGLVANGIYDTDSVLARFAGGGYAALAGGEFVTTARHVTPATMPTLQAINQTGQVPRSSDNGDWKEVARELRRGNSADNDRLIAKFDEFIKVLSEAPEKNKAAFRQLIGANKPRAAGGK